MHYSLLQIKRSRLARLSGVGFVILFLLADVEVQRVIRQL